LIGLRGKGEHGRDGRDFSHSNLLFAWFAWIRVFVSTAFVMYLQAVNEVEGRESRLAFACRFDARAAIGSTHAMRPCACLYTSIPCCCL